MYQKYAVASGWDQSSSGRIAEAKQAKDAPTVVQKGVEAGQLPKHLDARHGDDGSTIRFVGPVPCDSLLEGILALKNSGRIDDGLKDRDPGDQRKSFHCLDL